MEWYVVQTQDLHGIFSSLGSPVGNDYHVGENCLASLGEILACLSSEDRSMRNFRRALGITQVIQTDLIPLLIHAKDDIKVMDATIRVLVNLTLPVECLLPLDSHSQSECGCQTISDLNYLLLSAKEAFVEPRSTQCLVQRMRAAIDKGGILAPEECESIGNCLLLLRNILHIPEKSYRSQGKSHHSPLDINGAGMNTASSKQNLILWNLFAQNFDRVLLHLMTCPQRAEWEVPMVQLVALTFKDQRMASLLKMLHVWLETSMSSESSEDNESNTSPQPLGSDNSSPVLTSEATSDSSDNGAATRGKASQKGERKSGMSSEEERGTYLTARVTRKSDTPDIKNPSESQSETTSPHLDSSNKEEELQSGDNLKAEAEEKSCRGEEEGIGEENEEKGGVKSERRRDEVDVKEGASGDDGEDGSNGDKDSGVFSEAASPCQPSFRGEKKVHLHPYQRLHHHKQHRYSHHHHCMHYSNSKKESSFATPNNVSSPSNGMAKAASELSDCGYSTQVENQPESLSTSSNEDEGPIPKRLKLGLIY